jgi:hypothetical protein
MALANYSILNDHAPLSLKALADLTEAEPHPLN